MTDVQTPSDAREALIREILDVPIDQHFARIERIKKPFVLARGESLTTADGYSNPALLEGCNHVMAYLRILARDHGVELRGGK